MKINKISIKNFRLLKDACVDLEEDLSLIIGKNNSGKTSLLSILYKFINASTNEFTFDDFSFCLQKELTNACTKEIEEKNFKPFEISLKLYINYSEQDNLEAISKVILDLDQDIHTIVLSFRYTMDFPAYKRLRQDFQLFKKEATTKGPSHFLMKFQSAYFVIKREALEFMNEANSVALEEPELNKLINLQYIDARRDVANSEGGSGRTLSRTSAKLAKNIKSPTSEPSITGLQKAIFDADESLTKQYKTIFSEVVEDIKIFSPDGSEVEVQSSLQEAELFKDNTTVKYHQNGSYLPEHYNGLGYMNLFAIIFNIHIRLHEFKRLRSDGTENQAAINLLFIEEPEAHTHPQMQYIFINNIKTMLGYTTGAKSKFQNLQTIITTHSSHIASQASFDDIKYFFCDKSDASVTVKNLSDLQRIYANAPAEAFKFLKRFLTLNNAELFFADKVIVLEGATERILLPAMMQKHDQTIKDVQKKLHSQNISIIEVGNYAHVFDRFFSFLNIKALIITDLDAVEKTPQTDSAGKPKLSKKTRAPLFSNTVCEVKAGALTSNASLQHFFGTDSVDKLLKLQRDGKTVLTGHESTGATPTFTYQPDPSGNIMVAFQGEENGYTARSFEDAFISSNIKFIASKKDDFESIKANSKDKILSSSRNFFQIANEYIVGKPLFASEVLYHSDDDFKSWATPKYILEGIAWLAK